MDICTIKGYIAINITDFFCIATEHIGQILEYWPRSASCTAWLSVCERERHNLYCEGSLKRHSQLAALEGSAQLRDTINSFSWYIAFVRKQPSSLTVNHAEHEAGPVL